MSIFKDGLFEGQVGLITGGGTGIGRGITEALAILGARTAILSRNADHLHSAADEITQRTGRGCLAVPADVREPEQVDSAVAGVLARFGRLDFVVNAAAGNFLCWSADLSPKGFGTVIDIDTKGTWNVTRSAFRAGLSRPGGSILNISATLHLGGTPGQVHVAAAKAAIDAMTRTLAVEWGPLGLRVNAIAPGPIIGTEGARRLFPGEFGERLRENIPTRRLGLINDIANLAVFLLSEAASNINGAIVVSDGGLSLAGRFGLDVFAT